MQQKSKFKAILAALLVLLMVLQACPVIPAAAEESDQTYAESIWDDFVNPPPESKSRPLWFWNIPIGQITEQLIEEVMTHSYNDSGYYGFAILPNWIADYMSPLYLERYGHALKTAQALGQKMCLYDEDGYPSGYAGGLMKEKYPEHLAKRLDKTEMNVTGPVTGKMALPTDGDVLGAVAYNTETFERINLTDNIVIVDDTQQPEVPAYQKDSRVVATASSQFNANYTAAKMVDGVKGETSRWNAADKSASGQWIALDFGRPIRFNSIYVDEMFDRCTQYEVFVWDAGTNNWGTTPVASGTTLGHDKTVEFKMVVSQKVKVSLIKMTSAVDSFSISEFAAYCYGQDCRDVAYNNAITTASSTFTLAQGYDAGQATDGNAATRWNAGDLSGNNQWLQVTFEKAVTVDGFYAAEPFDRTRSFEIQYYNGSAWVPAYTGTTISDTGTEAGFSAVTATQFRLHISATDKPSEWSSTISEFDLLYNGKRILNPSFAGSSHLAYDLPEGPWKIMIFNVLLDGWNNVNYLDADAVAKFIELTHQAYYDAFPEYFGTVIDSAFFDEPAMWYTSGGRMWTEKFNTKFEAKYGYDPMELYPALWYDIGEDTEAARSALFGFRGELFATDYIKQMNDWCDAHGIKQMGHIDQEESLNPTSSEGDLMACFKYAAVPSVDSVFSYNRTRKAFKIVSSSAYNWDKPEIMTEVYGAMGEGMGIPTMYKEMMDEFSKGINYVIPHAIWEGTSVNPPELSWRNSKYGPELWKYNEYVGRTQSILKGGRHVADIGILYPIDNLQSFYYFGSGDPYAGGATPSESDYMNVGDWLSTSIHRDFTFVHPEVLRDKCTVEGDVLKLNNEVNFEAYKVFIMPGGRTISLESIQKIKEYYDAGGKVIATTQLPYMSKEFGKNEEVTTIVKEMFGIDPQTGAPLDSATGDIITRTNAAGGTVAFIKTVDSGKLKTALDAANEVYDVEVNASPSTPGGEFGYIHKVKENTDFYFFSNSGSNRIAPVVDIKGTINPTIWNPHTGMKYIPKFTHETVDGQAVTRVVLTMEPIQSLFIVDEPIKEDEISILISSVENLKGTVTINGQSYQLPVAGIFKKGDANISVAFDDPNYEFVRFGGDYFSANNPLKMNLQQSIALDVYAGFAGGQSLAYGATVTTRDVGATGAWGPGKLVDGIRYSSSESIGFTSGLFNNNNFGGTPYPITLDMKKAQTFDTVTIYPRTDETTVKGDKEAPAAAFPVDYEIQVSDNGTTFTSIKKVTNGTVPNATGSLEIAVPKTTAQYIRLSISKVGAAAHDDPAGRFRLQMSEIAVTNNAQDLSPTLTINGTGGAVKVNGFMHELPLTMQQAAGTPLIIEPVPNAGSVFSGVKGEGMSDTAPILVTMNHDISMDLTFSAMDEVKNVAIGATATSNNSIAVGGAWGIERLNDGVTTGTGYSSNTFETPDASSNPVNVKIDFGSVRNINKVRLYPRSDNETAPDYQLYYPADFTIVTTDASGKTTTVKTIQGETPPETAVGYKEYIFDAIDAQSVSVVVTKLGGKTPTDKYRVQFAEMQVYNTGAEADKLVTGVAAGETGRVYVIPQLGGTLGVQAGVAPENALVQSVQFDLREDSDIGMYYTKKAEMWLGKNEGTVIGLEKGQVSLVAKAQDGTEITGTQIIDIMPDGKSPEIEAGMVDENGNPIDAAVLTNEEFTIKVVTAGEVEYVKFTNENDMSIGKKATVVTVNEDGSKTWLITMALATAGEDRELNIWTAGADKEYTVTGVSVKVDIASVEPAVVSAAGGTTRAGKNEVFTITVVTSKSIDKVKLANESGASIGILTKSFVVEGNTKVWTLTAKIGTAGERTVTAFGAPKDEDYLTQGQSFGITITK